MCLPIPTATSAISARKGAHSAAGAAAGAAATGSDSTNLLLCRSSTIYDIFGRVDKRIMY